VIGVWDAMAPWLATDTTADPIVPLLTGQQGLADLLQGRIYRRRAEQPASRPYLIVTGPLSYDHGHHSTGVLTLKLCRFSTIVVSERTVSQIAPVVNRLVTILERTRQQSIGSWWIQAVLLEDLDEDTAESPTGNEQGSPAYVLNWLVGYARRED